MNGCILDKCMEETWKRIDGFDLYEVSSFGQVRRGEKIRRGGKNHKGYYMIDLWNRGVQTSKAVHRIVAEAFIPNEENKPCVDHINRNILDNRVENLRWVTHSENNLNKSLRELDTYGITWNKKQLMYHVQVRQNNKQKYIGRVKTLIEAKTLRDTYISTTPML